MLLGASLDGGHVKHNWETQLRKNWKTLFFLSVKNKLIVNRTIQSTDSSTNLSRSVEEDWKVMHEFTDILT